MTALLALVSITIGGITAEPGTAVSRMVSIPGGAALKASAETVQNLVHNLWCATVRPLF